MLMDLLVRKYRADLLNPDRAAIEQAAVDKKKAADLVKRGLDFLNDPATKARLKKLKEGGKRLRREAAEAAAQSVSRPRRRRIMMGPARSNDG